MNNNVNKDKDTKKILAMVVLILTLMVSTTTATYAWLAIGAVDAGNVTGTVAGGGLAFQLSNNASTTSGTPTLLYPTSTYASKPMVPQYAYSGTTNILQKAINGTGSNKCVDGNGNVICRVYTFTIRNNATATVKVHGKVYFSGAPTNLKWALMTNAGTVAVTGTTTTTNFRSPVASATAADCTVASPPTNGNNCLFAVNKSLNPSGGASSTSAASGSYQQYWLVFWINETGAVQNDSGTWTATMDFVSSNGTGITSTIVS